MDGLDDQAEAVVEGIIDQFFTKEVVTVKHSSRDSLMLRITNALKDPNNGDKLQVQKLIFRSGISIQGLRWLEEALETLSSNQNQDQNQIKELEFRCLQSIPTLELAIVCTRRLGIRKLSLTTYGSRAQTSRINRDLVASTIRSGLLVSLQQSQQDDDPGHDVDNDGDAPATESNSTEGTTSKEEEGKQHQDDDPTMQLEYLSLSGYPLGSKGIEILSEALPYYATTLTTLKLIDCDLRSDSNMTIVNIIKANTQMERLDLSHNRHYLGSSIGREMTMKTLIRRGLIFNTNLLELKMDSQSSSPSSQQQGNGVVKHNSNNTISSKLERQLEINKFLKAYKTKRHWDPMALHPHRYSAILAYVSSKPSVLYYFVQENIPILFPFY